MASLLKVAALAASIAITGTFASSSMAKEDRETFTLPEDQLAVTVGGSGIAQSSVDDSKYSIWVGEVELGGRKAVWVELIDEYGEVVYDSEVNRNETHLLPDGRAIVVRALDEGASDEPKVAKVDQSRIAPDARLVVTRRVVDFEGTPAQTAIEFIEEKPQQEKTALIALAEFGNSVWAAVIGAFESAADGVRVAWDWLFGTANA
ncbi:hypothetical protein [Stappia sediminis]|nr:hypothetical protein [Stappia sediminis]